MNPALNDLDSEVLEKELGYRKALKDKQPVVHDFCKQLVSTGLINALDHDFGSCSDANRNNSMFWVKNYCAKCTIFEIADLPLEQFTKRLNSLQLTFKFQKVPLP